MTSSALSGPIALEPEVSDTRAPVKTQAITGRRDVERTGPAASECGLGRRSCLRANSVVRRRRVDPAIRETVPVFELKNDELVPFRRVTPGPELFESEVEDLLGRTSRNWSAFRFYR